MPFAPTWPMHLDPVSGPMLDRRALVSGAAGADDSWTPLVAAFLAVGKPSKSERAALLALLESREVEGFAKSISPGKAGAVARAAGIDLHGFCLGMVASLGVKALPPAIEQLGSTAMFAALDEHPQLELRVGKELPPGTSQLTSLRRLGLLHTKKLRSDRHMAELAELDARVALTLVFDGRPDRMTPPPPVFLPPDLALFTAGDFGSLAFESTGSAVELSVEHLAPLAEWRHLERLSLRHTSLATLSLEAFADVRRRAPGIRVLVLAAEPTGDWRAAWPDLELRLGRDERLAP